MDHSTCQELYFHEWQRKEEISAASALPVALLSAFLGADVFLIRGFEYEGGWSTNSFLVLIAVSVVVQLIAAWWIIRSYYGYWYERIPATRVLLKYKSDLIKYYEQTGGTAEEAEKEFESYYVERLAEATDSNRDNNLKAGDALHNATRSLIGALIVLALSAVPFVYETRGSFGSTASVSVADPVNVVLLENSAMPNEQNQNQNNSQGGQTGQNAPAPSQEPVKPSPPQPIKPSPPQNELVRKGDGARTKK